MGAAETLTVGCSCILTILTIRAVLTIECCILAIRSVSAIRAVGSICSCVLAVEAVLTVDAILTQLAVLAQSSVHTGRACNSVLTSRPGDARGACDTSSTLDAVLSVLPVCTSGTSHAILSVECRVLPVDAVLSV
jgi:hypothetical protein